MEHYKHYLKTAKSAMDTARKYRRMGYHADAVRCQELAARCRCLAIYWTVR